MKPFSLKSSLALSASALLLAGLTSAPSHAQEDGFSEEDEIITIGTRRANRSAADSPAPVDIIGGDEILNQASNDITDLIRVAVPSYNVNTQPISDAATLVRPANLRGLSPDHTLVLVNGKRRHRASVIAFLGGGLSDGAQGADVGVFPAIGLKNVEVLRDGAASQYGSDAIAGVINFQLKDASEGGMVEAKYGSTFEGDGTTYSVAGNIGLPLGEQGFVNITGEYSDTEGTIRSVQRDDALALIAAGNAAVGSINVNTYTDEVVQYWGQPDVEDDYKIWINSGFEISDQAELYALGNYASRTSFGGFFYRNPTNRGGVYAGPTVDPVTGAASSAATAVPSVRVGDLDGLGVGGACPAGIPLTAGGGLIPDPTILAAVTADPNCFSFVETIPGGFTPRFGGTLTDYSIIGGIRGELAMGDGLGYDISATLGNQKSDFEIRNTVNASLGPNTPRDFDPGAYTNEELRLRADFSYGLPMEGWASDLNIAAGVEYAKEEFTITAGDANSYALGPLGPQGFSSSSNGFGGFNPESAGTFDQSNIGIYGELDGDITDNFNMIVAVRYEDFNNDAIGDTFDYKVGALYKLTEDFRLRGTWSTGFHAASAGQANVRNVTTAFGPGGIGLVDQGTLPPSSAPAQLGFDFVENQFGTRPTLKPEEATNLALGVAFSLGNMDWTVDYFNIDVKDRISILDQISFIDILNFAGIQNGVLADTSGNGLIDGGEAGFTVNPGETPIIAGLRVLDAGGFITRSDFNGFEDLTSFAFFSNNFDTASSGFDIVGKMPLDIGRGSTSVTLAANYTNTTVENDGKITPLSSTRRKQLEQNIPNWKGNIQISHEEDSWRLSSRLNFHSNYFEAHLDDDTLPINAGGEITLDVEGAFEVMEGLELIGGVANLFNDFPDENPFAGIVGSRYPATAPLGFNGGQYYVKARYTF